MPGREACIRRSLSCDLNHVRALWVVRMIYLARLASLALASALAVASPCAAQQTSAQSGEGSSNIFQPIALQKLTDLEFGTVVRPATGQGVVTVDAATGARSLSGSGALLGSGSAATRATFSVGGEGGQAFGITVPATMTMTRTGGSETISVTLSSTDTSGVLTGALGSAGTASFGVGGGMTVTSAAANGAYAGNFQVVVTYN